MGMSKGTAGMGTGNNAQYVKKGGKITSKKKMGTGGAAGKVQVKSPNKAAAVSPKMKGGGMYKMGGKKGM